ncbi:MAG TPA: hypothetical protein PLC15_10945 [Candidatus Obscuribacter sp.]|nr:hypothetical protein [Candidatus Obscuribacter sp.]HMX46101.1 hypothetical protein [Candidatus Obscuribacter sp.]HMY51606.1 hypothetical protein [Candidatus Obscuribacter sp.]HNB15894.1 hypothetical protein [Candidatus Obscuribacter sp.]HND05687.1 hypothetical protein [Candidatus Obscuribacter sp.]
MKNHTFKFPRTNAFLAGAFLSVLAAWASVTTASAQSIDGSFDLGGGATGGVTMGANGPTGVLSNGATGDSIQIGGGGPGFALSSGPASLGDSGTIGRTSFRTGYGNQGMGNIQDGMTTGSNNPLDGRGSNFGLSGTQTGLMAPNSFSNAPMPVTATNSGHMDYGFTAGPQQYYDSMYGLTRAGNNLIDDLGRRLTGGFINSGRQSLPRVSTGSVDFNTVTRSSAGFGP